MYHMHIKITFFKKRKSYIFFILFSLIVCLFTITDYGIGIEEHFQRKSGLYWLNFLLQLTNFENLKEYTR